MHPRDSMGNIVRSSVRRDPTIYPVDEKVGENTLQRYIAEALRPLIERWLRQRRARALVGADQFIYYRQHMPTARVSPDVYVMPGFAQEQEIGAWKTWETGVVPSFALEIVSRDWEKDYVESPARYAELGAAELVIFDPHPDSRPDGARWQVYRRVRGRGLTLVEVSQGSSVVSKALGCHLVRVGAGAAQRIRLGTGPHGRDLFPTAEEAERAAREAAMAQAEAAQAAAEASQAAAEAALRAKGAALAEKDAALVEKQAALVEKQAALARVAELEAKLSRRARRRQ
jgi:hypothetical protein